jgi:fibronectin-binding autotransporter adhesin
MIPPSVSSGTILRSSLPGLLLLCVTAPPLSAQTYDWTAVGGGNWNTAANWSPAGPPVAAGTARFAIPNNYAVSLTANTAVGLFTQSQGDLTLHLSGFTLQTTNTLNNGMGATGTSALTINNGTFLPGNFSVGANFGSTSTLNLNPGTTTTIGSGVFFVGTAGTGTVNINGGADLTSGANTGLGINATGTGTATVNGAGSTWTVNGSLRTGITGNGTLNILNGGAVTATALVIGENPGGTGTMTIGGANSVFTTAGTTNIGGLFDAAPSDSGTLTINTGGTANFNGNTLLRTTSTVNVSGGTLNLNNLTVTPGAVFNWTAGTVQFANASTLTDPVLQLITGGTHTIGAGRTLTVSDGTLDFNSGTVIRGGTLNAGDFNINAPLTITEFGRVATTGVVTVGDDSVVQVEAFGTLGSTSLILNDGGLLQLNAPTATVSGFTANNSGTIQGTGRFTAGLNNGTGGTIRARAGDHLIIHGIGPTNPGRIELSGGTIEYTKILSNLGNGIISGRGEFRGGTDNPGGTGLANSGLVALSGGLSDFHGDLQNNPTGRVITSGGAIVTLYDDLKHNGAEFKVSAASSVVCFGEVSGAGSFTGSGTLYMEGGYSPGNSPAMVTLGTNVILGDDNLLTLELGGHTPGSEYDQILLDSSGSLTAGGSLTVSLLGGFMPAAGDTFQVLRFGPGQVSGAFDSITLNGTLAPGTWMDTGMLLQTGVITVVPEPSASLMALSGAFLFLRRSRSLRATGFAGAPERRNG